MPHETTREVLILDQADCGRGTTRFKGIGDRLNRLKIDFGISACDRSEKIRRHKQTAGEAVGDALGMQRPDSRPADILGLAEEDASPVMVPMTELVPDRKALPTGVAAGIDGYDRSVGRSDDARFASIKRSVA